MRGYVCHGVLLENINSLLVLIYVRQDFWTWSAEYIREMIWMPRLAKDGGRQHIRVLLPPAKKAPLSSLTDFISADAFSLNLQNKNLLVKDRFCSSSYCNSMSISLEEGVPMPREVLCIPRRAGRADSPENHGSKQHPEARACEVGQGRDRRWPHYQDG